eukprot:TRINITY_DN3822_c0_g1_i1.p1 TRINITY_DN3822_c0_g1~~TRINITY_DN3822_c0_g1_i1.p1  ORF type:complete len:226 (+),score=10.47 TRINITY_DN3822_c0_g1_i1:104-781(+)
MVRFRDADTSEVHHFEVVPDNEGNTRGRVDWVAAMEDFGASHLGLINDGIELNISYYRSGERKGLTRRFFDPNEEVEVRAEKRQNTDWVDKLLHPDHSSHVYVHQAVGRLTVKEGDGRFVNAGSIVRVSAKGLMVTTRHSCVDGGVLLELHAFDSKLEFVAASPSDDIIFLQVRTGRSASDPGGSGPFGAGTARDPACLPPSRGRRAGAAGQCVPYIYDWCHCGI